MVGVEMNSTLSNHTGVSVVKEGGRPDNKVVTIYAGASVGLFIVATCVLLCCRELSRRRLESRLMDELGRRELIKRSVKHKLEQMAARAEEETQSYMEHMELKVPYVTFGEVTKISPTPSFVELHHRNLSAQSLPAYPYHHLHEAPSGVETALVHGDHHHHVGPRTSSSLFAYLKSTLFSRSRARSDSSGSGSEEEMTDVEVKVADFTL